jgi:hypothetical protein
VLNEDVSDKNTSPIDLNGEVEAENRNTDDSLDYIVEFELSGSHVNCSPHKKKINKKIVVVETQVRRSPIFKDLKKGFKGPQCKDKACLDCNASPPSLSANTIRRLGVNLCNIDPALLTDEKLNKKKNKKTTPLGKGPSLKKGNQN